MHVEKYLFYVFRQDWSFLQVRALYTELPWWKRTSYRLKNLDFRLNWNNPVYHLGKRLLTSRKIINETLMNALQPVVLEENVRFLAKKHKFCHFLAFWLKFLQFKKPFPICYYWMMLLNCTIVYKYLDVIKPACFEKKTITILKTLLTDMQHRALSSNKTYPARNQTKEMTFLMFLQVKKNWLISWWIKCNHWCLRKAVLFYIKNRTTSNFRLSWFIVFAM